LQYACDPLIRDGTTQNTIPTDPQNCINYNCDRDVRFCRHESFDSYKSCVYRQRNKGLFTANQNLRGDAAIYTRQNPDGNRRGLECPEERDYYPYWHPTIWRDAAIFTNQPSRCAAYKAESENVKGRWYCWTPDAWKASMEKKGKQGFIPINKDDCENPKFVKWTDPKTNATTYGKWVQADPWGIDAPKCYGNVWTRDNHLGNVEGGYPNGFNWTVPSIISENCVFRLRYNISTGDFPGFANLTSVATSYVDWTQNSISKPDADADPANLTIWTQYGLNYTDVQDCFDRTKNNDQTKLKKCREYVLKNNPKVDIFGPLLNQTLKLQLAINTAQYGRTFQDRSHNFGIRQRPSELNGAIIHNLQVRGKRGNIVQVFPGTEYDFAPNLLHVKSGDYVHIQWTGSNTNPNNNAGEGRAGSDRSNIVALRPRVYYEGQTTTFPTTYGQWGGNYPANLINDTQVQDERAWRFLGLSRDDLEKLAILKNMQYGGSMYKLDDAGTYFDLGPRQITQTGTYHYLCTRNNNFSNRSQKGKIVVSTEGIASGILDSNGGSVSGYNVEVSAAPGALNGVVTVRLTNSPSHPNASIDSGGNPFTTVSPIDLPLNPGQKIKVSIPFNKNPVGTAKVYQATSVDGEFVRMDAEIKGTTATVETDKGGVFVVKNPNNYGAIFGTLFACLFVIALIAYFVYRRQKQKQAATTAAVKQVIQNNESSQPSLVVNSTPVVEPPTGTSQSPVDGRLLPAGWQAVTDPKDGATYYVHPTTGASQWEFPEA
jgi:plastocyanin/cbb3-type cytochrome oxidase subunit 3